MVDAQREADIAFETHWAMEKIGLQLQQLMRKQRVTRTELTVRLKQLRGEQKPLVSAQEIDNLLEGKTADIDLPLLVELFTALGQQLNLQLERRV